MVSLLLSDQLFVLATVWQSISGITMINVTVINLKQLTISLPHLEHLFIWIIAKQRYTVQFLVFSFRRRKIWSVQFIAAIATTTSGAVPTVSNGVEARVHSTVGTVQYFNLSQASVFIPMLHFNHLLQCFAIQLRSIISGNQCVHIEQSYWQTYHHHYHHHHIIDGLFHYHHCRASVSRTD